VTEEQAEKLLAAIIAAHPEAESAFEE
jgi:hypothetical protein